MNDNRQLSKLASAAVALVMLALGGFGLWHGNPPSPRPYSLEVPSHQLLPGDNNRVESRLWQDPFEAFATPTNEAAAASEPPNTGGPGPSLALSAQSLGMGINLAFSLPASPSPAASPDRAFWDDFNRRAARPETRIAVLGVMLDGGSYPEDREVRLRLRYAGEVALLTAGLGPEDRNHIATNALWLPQPGPGDHGRSSKFAYEWFGTRTNAHNLQTCVLWLNENDFGDDPALDLGSLLTNAPALIRPGGNASFYLIGPRYSDTLRALAQSLGKATPSANVRLAAQQGRFHIISPESTAAINDANDGDPDGIYAWQIFSNYLGPNVFNNWITTDQKLATLIAREISNRMSGRELASPNNVVVLLSEQDTYYGSKLAQEWSDALRDSGAVKDRSHVWQFGYLRGLDGSKPAAGHEDPSPDLADTPDSALQSALVKQQTGEKADGDAQLDYVVRLAGYLQQKDAKLQTAANGRIVAVGLTGSDVYDKLILLQQLRPRLPGAVFFTCDLDAPLWTSRELPFTRNLLVGSAYSPEPDFDLLQDDQSEFEPFRDVYQKSVFLASFAVVTNELNGAAAHRLPGLPNLAGGVYKIGWHGPVKIEVLGDTATSQSNTGHSPSSGVLLDSFKVFLACLFGGVIIVFAVAALTNGFRQQVASGATPQPCDQIQDAEEQEHARQIPLCWLLTGVAIGLIPPFVYGAARWIASQPGEEPWNFTDGVSIWTSEFIRMLVALGGVAFFFIARHRRKNYRKTLWEKYFNNGKYENEKIWRNRWEKFYTAYWRNVWPKYWVKLWEECCRGSWLGKQTEAPAPSLAPADAKTSWAPPGTSDARQEEFSLQDDSDVASQRRTGLIFSWLPPFLPNPDPRARTPDLHMLALFRHYFRLGLFLNRLVRMLLFVSLFLLGAGFIVRARHDIPTTFNIRGHYSHYFDSIALLAGVFMTLFVLAYVLDGALLTKRVLDAIGRFPTRWPESILRRRAFQFGVQPKHLDGLVDVEFAALQTGELGVLMLWPIFLLLLLVVSRHPWLNNWAWTPSLICIFAANFVAAGVGWWMIRRSAENVRQFALNKLEEYKRETGNSGKKIKDIPTTEELPDETANLTRDEVQRLSKAISKQDYLSHLDAVSKVIADEQRGAYARWFQDPTYLAVFIPSGLSGLIPLIGWLWPDK